MNDKPVDKLAGVGSGSGESFQYSYKISRLHSKDKLPVRQFPGAASADITGLQKGNLFVVGVFLQQKGKDLEDWDWVVQCNCGYYEIRTYHNLKDRNNKHDCCLKCEKGRELVKKQTPKKCCENCRYWKYDRVVKNETAIIRVGLCKEISKHILTDAHGNKSYVDNPPFEIQRTFYCNRYNEDL